jgi:DNA-binding GntR family transcriptional regulator
VSAGVDMLYEELEREAIIYRRQGLGTFVSDAAANANREVKTAYTQSGRQGAPRHARKRA